MTSVRSIFVESITTRNDVLARDISELKRAAGRFAAGLIGAVRALQAAHRARIMARQLRSLDRRLLADIGYQTSHIDPVARVLAGRSLSRSRRQEALR
jgi:uncharacterized protein YjiS (DUF1127 family)